MTYTVEIEDFTEGMLCRVSALMGTHFPAGDRLLTQGYHDWLCLRNPFGVAKGVIVRQGDHWAGFMALVPVVMRRASETRNACFVVNVLVDPSHQGQNLFGRMIAVAAEWAKAENVVLMGHPNAAANPFWRRKRMHFHEELRPAVAIPGLAFGRLKVRSLSSRTELVSLRGALEAVTAESARFKIAATPDFIAWRFLDHPDNTYVLQQLALDGEPIGMQISKRLKPGVNLLIDQFLPENQIKAANRRLPPATLHFVPGELVAEAKRGLLSLPWKKRMPMFATSFSAPIVQTDAAELFLSASDF